MSESTQVATPLVTIDPPTYVKQTYESFEKRLEQAIAESKDVTYTITTKEGMEVAKANRNVFKAIRIELEKKRAECKAPILEVGKLLDSRAKEIEAKVRPLEERFDADIKAEEKRIEDEKAAKIKAEAERNAQIQGRIDNIKSLPLKAMSMTSQGIQEYCIDAMNATIATAEIFGERFVEAEIAIAETTKQLNVMLEGKKAQEELAAQQEAQRIENERLAKIAAEEKAKAEAEAKAAQAAEAERLARERAELDKKFAELQAMQDSIDKAKAEEEAKAQAKAKAEQDAIVAKAKAEERARIEAEQKIQHDADVAAIKAQHIAAEEREKARFKEQNNHHSEAVKQDGARPALVQTEPAAPATATVTPITKHAMPRAAIVGQIEVVEVDSENFKTSLGMLIVFDTPEQLRAALHSGTVSFSFMEDEAAA